MSKSFRRLLTATTTFALLFGTAAAFAEETSTKKDLNEYLSKDVMRLSGSEREISLALAHGYRVGKMGTTQFDNTIGSPELAVLCTDPDFDPAQKAFYYARVIEIPTPRWSTHDAFRFGIPLPEGAPVSTQERVYTSPIWYAPEGA
jgi:hypothetical protein